MLCAELHYFKPANLDAALLQALAPLAARKPLLNWLVRARARVRTD